MPAEHAPVVVNKKEDDKKDQKKPLATVDPKTGKMIFQAAIIDTKKLVESQARDVADHRLTESEQDRSGGFFKKMWKRMWHHNLAKEYYRQKEISKARGEILGNKNLYAGEEAGASGEAHQEAMSAIVDRFTSEYEDEMLKAEEKVTKRTIANGPRNNEIKDLIKEYAGSKMDKSTFDKKRDDILRQLDPNYENDGRMFADNLFDIAKEVKDAVDHGQKLNELDFDVELTLGEARDTLNTEAQRNSFDKVVEKVQNSTVGKYIANEGTVAVLGGLYSFGSNVLQRGLRSKAAQWGSFGATSVVAGGVAAIKESARISRERGQHMRERSKGMTFEGEDMKRREAMEKNLYKMRGAEDMMSTLESDLARIKSGEVKEGEINGILANLADLEARIKLGDQKKVDLISYSHFSTVERERTDLDLARARMKVELRKAVGSNTIKLPNGGNFDEQLEKFIAEQSQVLTEGEGGLEEKDRAFGKLKAKRMAGAFVKTTLVSAGMGFVFQEATSIFHPGRDNVISGTLKSIRDHISEKGELGGVRHMLDQHSGPLDHDATALEGFRRWMTGESPRMPFGVGHETILAGTATHFHLPEGVNFHPNPDGTFDLMKGTTVLDHGVHLDVDPKTGDLTQAAKDILSKNDIHTVLSNTGERVTETVNSSAKEYADAHKDLFHHIHRDGWYGQNTPMEPDPADPTKLLGADENELRTSLTLDKDGNYIFGVEHMTTDGSWQDGLPDVDAQEEIKKHGLTMLFSLSKDTQSQVIPVSIDEYGHAIIPKGSDIAKLGFETVNGHPICNFQFGEVAKMVGQGKDGDPIYDMLATHVGKGVEHVTDTITKDTIVHNIKVDVPDNWDYHVPYAVPLVPRRPLERGQYGEAPKKKPPVEGPGKNPDGGVIELDPMHGEDVILKDTDFVYGFIGTKATDLGTRVAAAIQKSKNPTVLVFEADPAEKDKFMAQIDFMKKKYPNVKFEYVPLRGEEKDLKDKKLADYIQDRFASILKASNIKNIENSLQTDNQSRTFGQIEKRGPTSEDGKKEIPKGGFMAGDLASLKAQLDSIELAGGVYLKDGEEISDAEVHALQEKIQALEAAGTKAPAVPEDLASLKAELDSIESAGGVYLKNGVEISADEVHALQDKIKAMEATAGKTSKKTGVKKLDPNDLFANTDPAKIGKVSDAEFKEFTDKNIVSSDRLNAIVDKVSKGEKLTPQEQAIAANRTSDIEVALKAKKNAPAAPAIKVASGPTTATESSPGGKMKPETDYVMGIMAQSGQTIGDAIETFMQDSKNKKIKNPAFVVFEADKKRAGLMSNKIDALKAKYPNIQVEYVPLPANAEDVKDTTAQEYMKSFIDKRKQEAGVKVTKSKQKIEGNSTLFKKES